MIEVWWSLCRVQGDYLGRGAAVRTGGAQDFGGNPRGMLGGAYGANRAEAELVAQYGGGGGRTSGAASTGAGYGGNQQASVYGVMTGGRGPGGNLKAKSFYILMAFVLIEVYIQNV